MITVPDVPCAIYKYPLGLDESRQPIEMPEGAEVVHVDAQDGVVTMWARVKFNSDMTKRTFRVVGTGWKFDPELQHVGTCQIGPFVWHVMEELRQAVPVD